MSQLVASPVFVPFVMGLIALLGAVTNYIKLHSQQTTVNTLVSTTAKHEEQLNGSFAPRVQSIVNPTINSTAKRLDEKIETNTIPKVQ